MIHHGHDISRESIYLEGVFSLFFSNALPVLSETVFQWQIFSEPGDTAMSNFRKMTCLFAGPLRLSYTGTPHIQHTLSAQILFF